MNNCKTYPSGCPSDSSGWPLQPPPDSPETPPFSSQTLSHWLAFGHSIKPPELSDWRRRGWKDVPNFSPFYSTLSSSGPATLWNFATAKEQGKGNAVLGRLVYLYLRNRTQREPHFMTQSMDVYHHWSEPEEKAAMYKFPTSTPEYLVIDRD